MAQLSLSKIADEKTKNIEFWFQVRHYNEAVRDKTENQYWTEIAKRLKPICAILYEDKTGLFGGAFDSPEGKNKLKSLLRKYEETLTEVPQIIKVSDQTSIPGLMADIHGVKNGDNIAIDIGTYSGPIPTKKVSVNYKAIPKWQVTPNVEYRPFETVEINLERALLESNLDPTDASGTANQIKKKVKIYKTESQDSTSQIAFQEVTITPKTVQ